MSELTPEGSCGWCGEQLTDVDSFVVMFGEMFHNQPQGPDDQACVDREIASRVPEALSA